MSKQSLLRTLKLLEARLPDPETEEKRHRLRSLTDLELWELAAAVFEAEAILDNPLCVEGEIGCECRREAWELLGEARRSDVSAAAHRLHRDEEVNASCLHLHPGCACRDLATAALGEQVRPAEIRFEAGLLHRPRPIEAVTEASPLPSPEPEYPSRAEQPPEATEIQDGAPVAKRRSGDPPEPDPNRGRAWRVTMVKAEPGQSPGRAPGDLL